MSYGDCKVCKQELVNGEGTCDGCLPAAPRSDLEASEQTSRTLETVEEWCEMHEDSHRAATLLLAFFRGDCVHAFYYPDTRECDLCGAEVT